MTNKIVHNMLIGFAAVDTKDGQPYTDLQGDTFTEDALIQAAHSFNKESGVLLSQHQGEPIGEAYMFPFTKEIRQAILDYGDVSGVLIYCKPSPEELTKYQNGEYTGFSIGGKIHRSVEDRV